MKDRALADAKKCILVLEDSTTQSKMISRMLQAENAEVVTITTASEFEMSPFLFDCRFDAVLIDVHFGEVSGLDLLKSVHRRWPAAMTIMMTANGKDDFSVLAEARHKGANRVLSKPFNAMDVKGLFEDLVVFKETGECRPHIVLIDDSRSSAKIASNVLLAYNCRVSVFQNGEDAIQRLSFDHVDAILTDINMPGMCGNELIWLVRDVWADVGIVAMSSDEKLCEKRDMIDAFVPKPFGPEELYRAIQVATTRNEYELDC